MVVLKTSKGRYALRAGWFAWFLLFTHKVTANVSIGFGVYGVFASFTQSNIPLGIAGVVALLAGFVTKMYVANSFKKLGRLVD